MSDQQSQTLTEHELGLITAALRIAAEQYGRDAVTAQENFAVLGGVAIARVAQQFEQQQRDALALADRLEGVGAVELVEHVELENGHAAGDDDGDGDRCTNPGGHEWNRTAGEADEARLAGDAEHDSIRCIHCGADGDA